MHFTRRYQAKVPGSSTRKVAPRITYCYCPLAKPINASQRVVGGFTSSIFCYKPHQAANLDHHFRSSTIYRPFEAFKTRLIDLPSRIGHHAADLRAAIMSP